MINSQLTAPAPLYIMKPRIANKISCLNEAQRSRIKEAEAIEANYWFALANWAKTRDLLTPLDRKAAFNFGTMRSRNRAFNSLKQAQYALKIVEKAIELGFKG